MPTLSVHIALLMAQVLFGLWPVAGIAVLGQMSPAALIGLRTLLAAPLLFLLFRPKLPKPSPERRTLLLQLACLGFLGVASNQLLYAEGLKRTGPINAAILTMLIPAITVLIAWAAGFERPVLPRLLGIGLACSGAVILVTSSGSVDGPGLYGGGLGSLLIVANTVAYSAYLVLGRRVAPVIGGSAMVTFAFLFGALEAAPFTVPALLSTPFEAFTIATWGSLTFIVLGATVATYALNAYALARAESSLVAVYIYVQPLISGLAVFIAFGTTPEPESAIAALIIAAGIWLSIRGIGVARVATK